MQVQNIGTAAFVVLAAGAMGYAGSGVGFAAGHGHHHGHGATAFGGFSGATLFQQNTAQVRRQNNNCSDDNQVIAPSALTGSRVKSRCVTRDASFNKHTVVISGGAHANGGSSTASNLSQQNTAQKGRQNNNCAQTTAVIVLTGGRDASHCSSLDRSRNIHTLIKSRGAHADGGSGALLGTFQRNTAQEGRQNNNCSTISATDLTVTGGRTASHCANRDWSHNKHVVVESRGARAEGGSSPVGFADSQNTAQEGRQNNNCSDESDTGLTLTGSRADTRCTNKDGSFNKGTLVRGGGADVEGGSSLTGSVEQQNTAQKGRQNNNCAQTLGPAIVLTGGRDARHCSSLDRSRNIHTLIKSRGAHADGGSGALLVTLQQNTAQEGRQNNNCSTISFTNLTVTGGRTASHCANRDWSHNKHVVVESRGARAEGGSSPVSFADNQNTAQEGRQNNNCDEKADTTFTLTGSRADTRCTNKDGSFNKGTLVRGGGADVEGGSSLTGSVEQQNTAQEGRQNNNCDTENGVGLTLTGSRAKDRCATVDHSHNVHTIDESGGAETEGGSSVGNLFQQNVAQDGRQNNNCDNSNALTLTATGSRIATECVAVDKSKNIHTITR